MGERAGSRESCGKGKNGDAQADDRCRLCHLEDRYDLKQLARLGLSSTNRQLGAGDSRIWVVPFGFDQARRPFLPMFVTNSRKGPLLVRDAHGSETFPQVNGPLSVLRDSSCCFLARTELFGPACGTGP